MIRCHRNPPLRHAEYAGIQRSDDKPYIESFFGHYKTEEVYRTSYATLAEGQVGRQLYRIWYEAKRIHESLGYQTPQQCQPMPASLALLQAAASPVCRKT